MVHFTFFGNSIPDIGTFHIDFEDAPLQQIILNLVSFVNFLIKIINNSCLMVYFHNDIEIQIFVPWIDRIHQDRRADQVVAIWFLKIMLLSIINETIF